MTCTMTYADMSHTKTSSPVDLEGNFKSAMRRLIASVTLVTTASGDENYGMTATAVTSLSTTPPSLLICVNRSASIHPVLRSGQEFCINILNEQHKTLSMAFSGEKERSERFSNGNWGVTDAGIPVLEDATANILCRVAKLVDYATHSIVIGDVTGCHIPESRRSSLLYGEGRFLSAAKPSAQA